MGFFAELRSGQAGDRSRLRQISALASPGFKATGRSGQVCGDLTSPERAAVYWQ